MDEFDEIKLPQTLVGEFFSKSLDRRHITLRTEFLLHIKKEDYTHILIFTISHKIVTDIVKVFLNS